MAATENVTVLFTDLVGSTELASALSPAAAEDLRRAHFSVLRQAVAALGGTEVKNLGDGLMVVFPSTSAALSCAIAMQQGVDRDNSGKQRPLGLRVGLSGGEAAREADDYFGDPVIEAARLCAKAEGGQILAANALRVMAGRRSPFAFSSLGEIELKGLPEPIETHEVGWEPLGDVEEATSAVLLPARLAIVPLAGVVAREAESEILTDAFKRVESGEGREVVLVSGEAGLGKTTLVAEAARRGFASGACVLLGRCQEDLSASYAPFAEALHHYVAHAPDAVLAAHVATHGGELAKMVPALGQRLGEPPARTSTDPDTERYLLYGAVVGLLTLASSAQPLVLVLDDLQWSDKPSLQLLRHLVANVESARLLVLATFRDAELSGSHPLTEVLGALRREPGVHRIDLKGFDDRGVLAFMEGAAGQRLDDDGVGLAHALYRETDGNPFFVGEVLLNLIETRVIYQDDTGRWVGVGDLSQMALPSSVREVISARVARLGERAGQILSIAAVIGKDFDLDLLGRVSECQEGELLDILDGASAAALVREVADAPGRWSFSHALTQHTLYQDLGASRRARTHRQVAEGLEALCAGRPTNRVGELAHHWSNATQPVDADKAIGYARQAADAALAALAPDDAVRFFSQALGFFGLQRELDPFLGVDLLLGLGNAQRQAGIPAFRETLLEAARKAQEVGDPDRLVAAALANNRGFCELGVIDADKVAVLEAALTTMPVDDSAERALLLATLCNEFSFGPLDRRLALAQDAKAMAERLGDPVTKIRVLNIVHAQALSVPSLHEERTRESSEALTLARALGDPVHLYWTASWVFITAMQGGDFEQSDACFAIKVTLGERLRQPTMLWQNAFNKAGLALIRGDLDEAEELANLALQIGTDSGQPDAFAFYGADLMAIRFEQGRVAELGPLIAQVAADNPGVPAYHAAHAGVLLETQENQEALHILETAASDRFESLPLDAAWMDAVTNYSRAAIDLQAREPAEELLRALAPYHDQVPFTGLIPQPPVATHLGGLASVLGRYDEAEAYFAEATDLNTRGEMKFAESYTQLLWGRMLAARNGLGDVSGARQLLEQARSTAATKGYAMVERSATEALSTLA